LLSQTQARDNDQTPVRFQIVSLQNGSVLVAGKMYLTTAELNPPAVVGPGEKFTWTPPNSVSGIDNLAVSAFSIKAFDMVDSSTQIAAVKVNVAPINQPPTLNQSYTVEGVQRNAPYQEISFESLAASLAVADPEDVSGSDYSKIKFRIEQILGGQGLRVGSSFNTALIVDSVNNLFIPGQKLYWIPPSNTVGVFDAFTVTVIDNNSLPSSTTGKIKMDVSGLNLAPVMASSATYQTTGQTSSATMVYSTLPSAVTENTPYNISYNDLKTVFGLNDSDSPWVTFVFTSLSSGTFKKSSTTLVTFPGAGVSAPPATAVLAPGESLLYYPTLGLSGNGKEVLRVMAYDGASYSASTGILTVNISSVNHAPTIATTNVLYDTGTRNLEFPVDFADLAFRLGVQDQDAADMDANSGYNNMKFRIEQILNGQTLRVGSTSATATLVDSANNVLLPGQKIFWMPPNNSTGTFETFLVTAVDKSGASSMSVGRVSIKVSGNNQPPQIVAPAASLPNKATQNLQFVLTYDELKTALQASDVDSPWIAFVFTEIQNGSLIKGSALLNAFSAAASGTAPPGTSVLAPTESVIYMPTTNLNGNSKPVFKVRAYDGAAYSNEVEVKVDINRANLPPLFTRVNNFTGIIQDSVVPFTYAEFRAKTDVVDTDESGTQIKFKIKSTTSGVLKKVGAGSDSTLGVNDFILPNESYKWQANQYSYGLLNGFSVVAVDADNSETLTAIPVYFNVSAQNSPPVFLTTSSLSGATEDTPFLISHQMLVSSFPGSDVESGLLNYRITEFGEGVVRRNNIVQTTADLPIDVVPGEVISWTPPLNRNFNNIPVAGSGTVTSGMTTAFKVKLLDGVGAVSADTKSVDVMIAAVNDLPVFGAMVNLPQTTKNAAGGQVISFDQLAAAVQVVDSDIPANVIQYRVESVGSGKLRIGNLNSGVDVMTSSQSTFFVSAASGLANNNNRSVEFNWTPPLNGTGEYVVMTVRAFDGFDYSASTVQVKIAVNGSNVPPTLAASEFTLGVAAGTVGTKQNVPIVINYDTLLALSGAADTDFTPISFRILNLDNGKVQIGNRVVTLTGSTITPALILGPGEYLTWSPAPGARGLGTLAPTAFTISAYDNQNESTANATVKVNVEAVNLAPTVNAAYTYQTGVRNAEFEIDFADLALNLGVADVEDVPTSPALPLPSATGYQAALQDRYKNVTFRVEQLLGGVQLKIGNSTSSVIFDSNNRTVLPGQKLYWKPPVNGTGVFEAFTVTVIDNNAQPSSVIGKVSVNVNGTNVAPTISAQGLITTTARENSPFTITYDDIKNALNLSDVDNAWVTFVASAINNGTVKKSSNSFTAFPGAGTSTPPSVSVLAPNESIVFYPQAGLSGNDKEIITFYAYDGDKYSTVAGVVKVNISAVNQAPSLATSSYTFSTGQRNQAVEIDFADLALKLGVADRENVSTAAFTLLPSDSGYQSALSARFIKMSFRIEQVLGGQQLLMGTTVATSLPVDGTNNLFLPGQKIFWTPPNNATGSFDMFLVSVLDEQLLASAGVAKIAVQVNGGNAAPAVTQPSGVYPSNVTQDTAFAISYDQLRSFVGVTDSDSPWVSLVLTSISNGVLKKGSQVLVAYPGAATGAAPSGSSVIAPSEVFTYVPTERLSGNGKEILKLRAYDGAVYSGEVTVSVNINRVNLIPTLSAISDFGGFNQGETKEFLFSDLLSRSNAADLDESTSGALRFRIKSVNSGVLRRRAAGGNTTLNANDVMSAGETFDWTGVTGASGRLNAFSVVALDHDNAESAAAVPVFFNAAFVNSAPTFASTLPGLTGAVEDTPFVITHQMLVAGLPGSDVETGLLDYQITTLGEGTLKRGNITLTTADLPQILRPGESVTWTAPANRHNGNKPSPAGPTTAFSVKLRDDLGLLSSAAEAVKVNVASVNDAPVFGTVSKLSSTGKNNGVPPLSTRTILYTDIAASNPVTDLDADSITYRIESVGSGKLELIGASGAVDVANLMLTQQAIIAPAIGLTANISNEFRWTPPLNGTGEYLVMTVRAFDGTEFSASTTEVRIDVIGSNAPPTVAKTAFTIGVEAGTSSTQQGVPIVINYATLLAQSGAADTDLTPLYFRVTELNGGTLVYGSRKVTATGLISPVLTIGPGEWLTWTPVSTAVGVQSAFNIRAFDNIALSGGTVTVSVNINAVNQPPTLNASALFDAVRNQDKVLTVSDLITALNASDLEDGNNATLLKFRVEQVLAGGTLRIKPPGGTPTPVDSTFNIFNGGELIWTPPSNMTGIYEAFILSVVDKDNLASATTARISMDVEGQNARPVLNSDSTLTTTDSGTVVVGTLPATANENTPFLISYNDIKNTLKQNDTDSPWVTFVVKTVSNGVFKKSASSLVAFPSAGVLPPQASSVIAPSESVLFYPDSTAAGATYEIMQVFAYDGAAYSEKSGRLKLTIAKVNQAPTLNASFQFTGTRNTVKPITFAALAGSLGVLDREDVIGADYSNMKFRIEKFLGGQGLTIGASSTVALPFSDSNNLMLPGDTLFWTPANDFVGSTDVALVSVFDSTGLGSATVAKISIQVDGTSIAPILKNPASVFPIAAKQNTPFVMTYDQLKSYVNMSDADSSWTSLVITNINTANGILKKGTATMTGYSSTGTPTGTSVIAPTESIVYIPTTGLNSTTVSPTTLFTVKAYDGQNYSVVNGAVSDASAEVKLVVDAVNQAPLLTRVNDFTGAVQNLPKSFSYNDIRNLSDAFDAEETDPVNARNIKFRIKNINTGTLARTGPAPRLKAEMVAGDDIQPLDQLEWTGALNANGKLNGFSVVALDTSLVESAVAVPVYFQTAAVNNPPVFAATSFIAGGKEDIAMVITHQMLAQAYPGTDPETGLLDYQITAFGASGSVLKRGTQTLSGPDLPLVVKPGESLTWIPPANVNFTTSGNVVAFKVKLRDDNGGLSSDTKDVLVSLAAVNDAPVMGTPVTLAGAVKNKGIEPITRATISYANILANVPVTDVETDAIQYRIESVGSGKLEVIDSSGAAADVAVLQAAGTQAIIAPDFGATGNISKTFRWTPPLNGTGEFVVMKLRAFDGQDFSVSTVDVKMNVSGSNAEPSIAVTAVELGQLVGTAGTKQNVPLVITYDTLLAQSGATDTDLTPLSFRVTELAGGTLVFGSRTVSATGAISPVMTVGPGEWLTWTPPLNQSGLLAAFKMKAFDNSALSPEEATVSVKVDAVNQNPTLNATYSYTGANRNQEFAIDFADLAYKLDVKDAEDVTGTKPAAGATADIATYYGKVRFRVEQMLAGQSLRIGNDSATAVGVTTSANTFLPAQKMFWIPPTNSAGMFQAFRVSVLDSTGAVSPTTAIVSINVGGANIPPVLTLSEKKITPASTQNSPLTLTYDQLRTLLPVTDTDSSMVSYVVTAVPNGSWKNGSVTVVPFLGAPNAPTDSAVLSPGGTFYYTPSVAGNDLSILTLRAYDGGDYSTGAATIKLDVTPVNQAPTLNDSYQYTSSRNNPLVIEFSDLASKLGVADAESVNPAADISTRYNNIKLRIEGQLSGVQLKLGATQAGATAFSATNDTLTPANKVLVWQPPENGTGTFEAFTVTVIDSLDIVSARIAKVLVQVTGSNAAPTVSATPLVLGASGSSAVQNTPYKITHSQIVSALSAADSDGAWLSFVVTKISNGNFWKGSTEITTYPAAPVGFAQGSAIFGPNEELIYIPTANLAGEAVEVMRVRAFDGLDYSLEAVVQLKIAALNQVPTLTQIDQMGPGIQAVPFAFNYDSLRLKTNAADAEEPLPSKTLKFKLKSISGTLRRNTGTAISPNWVSLNTTNSVLSVINPGDVLDWKGADTASGLLPGFSIVALDTAGAESVGPRTVYFNIDSVNADPTFVTLAAGAPTSLTGASEDNPFIINHQMLTNLYAGQDNETGVLSYQITALGEGITWFKGSTQITTGMLPVAVRPGESITWTPNLNVNGLKPAFTVRLLDDNGGVSTETKVINVLIAPVNDTPQYGTPHINLADSTKNKAGGQSISYANVAAALPVSDLEGDVVEYRIEGIGAGVLKDSGGTQVIAQLGMRLVSSGTAVNTTTSLTWFAPQNGTGEYTVMTVRACDQTDCSPTTKNIKMKVNGDNDKPVIANTSFILGTTGGTIGTSQNVPRKVTYDELLTLSGATDVDATPISFYLTNLDSGALTFSDNVTYGAVGVLNPERLIGPGEWFLWKPSANQTDAAGISAFKFVAFDNLDRSVLTTSVKVVVNPVNQPPTVLDTAQFTVPRNTPITISFAELGAIANLQDFEDVAGSGAGKTYHAGMKFIVEEILSGSLQTVISGTEATANVASSFIQPTNSFKWLPALNVTGVQRAFKVSVRDRNGLASDKVITVQVEVTGSNAAPTTVAGPVTVTGGKQREPKKITYNDLKTLLNAQDSDSENITFVTTSISYGTLMKGGLQLLPYTGSLTNDSGLNNKIGYGEEVVFLPDSTTSGTPEVMRIRAYDGAAYSPEVVVRLELQTVYQTPTLTAVDDFNGLTQAQDYNFTYEKVREKAVSFASPDETPTARLKFKVKSVPATSGILYRITSAVGDPVVTEVLNPSSIIAPSDRLIWSPVASAYGRVIGFTATAIFEHPLTGGVTFQESVQAVPVYFNLARVNTPPVFANAGVKITGAFEDVPYILPYDKLLSNYPGSDTETGALTYVIQTLPNDGVYKKLSGSSVNIVTVANLPLALLPGEAILWTPPANYNGDKEIFTVKLRDNDNAVSSETKSIVVQVTAVNDLPAYAANFYKLPNTTKNISGGQLITWSQMAAAIPATDQENDVISYRIESVGSGTLRLGEFNTDSPFAAGLPEAMPRLVQLGTGNGTSTFDKLNWTPPLNATGEFLVMTVRACDASGCSLSTREVKIQITGDNAAPSLANTTIKLGIDSGFTGAGTVQNSPVQITHETMRLASGASDSDLTPVSFRIYTLESGKLDVTTFNGSAYQTTSYSVAGALNTPVLVGPGESVVWTPAFNDISNPLTAARPAFKFRAYDNQYDSGELATLNVQVKPVNQAPSITNNLVSYTGTRNTPYAITFENLADQLGVVDFEDVTLTPLKTYNSDLIIRIEEITSGSLSSGATPVGTGHTFKPTQSVTWTPANNVTGLQAALKVSVQDKSGLRSATIASVNVLLSGDNLPPSLSVSGGGAVHLMATLGKQNQAYSIAFDDLANALNLTDADSAVKLFVVTQVTGGQLFNGATQIVPHATAPNEVPAPLLNARFRKGESLVFVPDVYTVGVQEIFQVRGYDEKSFSGNMAVQVNFDPVYRTPTISAVSNFTGLTQGQDFRFTYDNLKTKTDVVSLDATTAEPVKFIITSMGSGTLKRITSAVGAGTETTEVMDSSTLALSLISKPERFIFSPAPNAYGTFRAFSIKAYQPTAGGVLQSVNPVDVNVVATKVNALPTFVGSAGTSPLPNAVEDLPLFISYNDLMTYYGGTDAESGAVSYSIVSLPVSSATYQKRSLSGSTAFFTAVDLPVTVSAGDIVIWTPPLNANAPLQDVFTVKLKDLDDGLSVATRNVQATVLSVNDTPAYGASTFNLANGSKNVNVNITHANVVAAIPFSDVENNPAEYRIESVGSGILYEGGTTTAVVAQTTRLASASGTNKITSLTWVPPSNAVGEFVIAQLRLCDAGSCAATVRDLKITLDGSNAAPTLDAAKLNINLGVDSGTTGTQQNVPLTVSYETLKTLSGANDTDGTVVKMQITQLNSGKLTVTRLVSGSYVTSEYTTANPPSGPVNLDSGESVVWTPALNAVSATLDTAGTISAFNFRAFDGVASSSAVAVLKVYVAPVNQAPTLDSSAALTANRYIGASSTPMTVSFQSLANTLHVADFEDVTA
ncbi:MAG: hypothetical protein EBR09_13180, partial [Proteobacteria bacterium]|nr:hypothetical protein [Pseudomonadota bacterium]